MTISERSLASIRYGYGFAPHARGATDRDALLTELKIADPFLKKPMIASWSERANWLSMFQAANDARRKKLTDAKSMRNDMIRKYRQIFSEDVKWHYSRPAFYDQAFRERLVAFWTDHFTVAAYNRRLSIVVQDMIQSAIRPHVTGHFTDMLQAVTTHPAMLLYLNQNQSIGPDSVIGKKRGRGLNENLAREILELHTLGVKGAYSQTDVREFAELLTGLRIRKFTFEFSPKHAERGAETVLGKEYGGEPARLEAPLAALADIALRPDTARHLASKLVTHFVGGAPDASHVQHVEQAYLRGGGDLLKVYEALLDHDNAWKPQLQKVRTPFELQIATIRALGAKKKNLQELGHQRLQRQLIQPLEAMGQPLMRPSGPDGWPEEPEHWITPSGLTARIKWAQEAARFAGKSLDPRKLLVSALRETASSILTRAVAGAATREEGLAIIFASPEFNRR